MGAVTGGDDGLGGAAPPAAEDAYRVAGDVLREVALDGRRGETPRTQRNNKRVTFNRVPKGFSASLWKKRGEVGLGFFAGARLWWWLRVTLRAGTFECVVSCELQAKGFPRAVARTPVVFNTHAHCVRRAGNCRRLHDTPTVAAPRKVQHVGECCRGRDARELCSNNADDLVGGWQARRLVTTHRPRARRRRMLPERVARRGRRRGKRRQR